MGAAISVLFARHSRFLFLYTTWATWCIETTRRCCGGIIGSPGLLKALEGGASISGNLLAERANGMSISHAVCRLQNFFRGTQRRARRGGAGAQKRQTLIAAWGYVHGGGARSLAPASTHAPLARLRHACCCIWLHPRRVAPSKTPYRRAAVSPNALPRTLAAAAP